MKENLEKTFDKEGEFDSTVIDAVRQRDPKPIAWMATTPTDAEIKKAITKLGNNKSGGDAKCPAEYYKCLEKDDEGRTFIRDTINDFWRTGSWPGDTAPELPLMQPKAAEAPEPEAYDLVVDASKNGWHASFEPNPHKPGTRIYAKYAAYCEAATVYDAWMVGAHWKDLAQDLTRGALRIFDPATVTEVLRPEFDADADKDGLIYDEWLVARLKLLPKKGDLSLCKNWRGICLLDIASKILSSVLVQRMHHVQNLEGLLEQFGFASGVGTTDGSYTTTIGLQKRKEHKKATWVFFIDLIKAFDTVIRSATFAVLRKFGFPDHFINIVIRLHANARIKFKVGDIDSEVNSGIGVRQGSIEGPCLFIFFFQAALETMEWPVAKPQFCTRLDREAETHGEMWNRKRDIEHFELWRSLFADDCALFFETRADLITGANYIYEHLRRFGLHMHVGRGTQKSKSEAMYCPAAGDDYEDADTSDFDVADGFISFCTEFKYLGSIIHYSLTSHADVMARIDSASRAFGALRDCVFANKRVKPKIKGKIYMVLILALLLYGSECWSLTAGLLNKLRSFHRRCVRKMCRITIAQTMRHRIPTCDLLWRLDIKPLDHYFNSRLLRWAGHLARMETHRLPRKLLTGWVAHPRRCGGQELNWGRSLKKALKSKNFPDDFYSWSEIAQDRTTWRARHTAKYIE